MVSEIIPKSCIIILAVDKNICKSNFAAPLIHFCLYSGAHLLDIDFGTEG